MGVRNQSAAKIGVRAVVEQEYSYATFLLPVGYDLSE